MAVRRYEVFFLTQEEKFRISARPCNIHAVLHTQIFPLNTCIRQDRDYPTTLAQLSCTKINIETVDLHLRDPRYTRSHTVIFNDQFICMYQYPLYIFTALEDYESALKLDPQNADLRRDSDRIRNIIQGTT